MIDRYSTAEMRDLLSAQTRIKYWLEIELLAIEGWAELGVIPKDEALQIRNDVPAVNELLMADIATRELETRHDVGAFVDIIESRIGQPHGRWIHFGLTSSDVVDTALSLMVGNAVSLVRSRTEAFLQRLVRRARMHVNDPAAGRTHGQFAAPTTIGFRLALVADQVGRDLDRLDRAYRGIRVGALSGPVGTFSNIKPGVEEHVCRVLKLAAVPSSQIIARDRHADVVFACAQLASTIEGFAMNVRLLSQSDVREMAEGKGAEQIGSSAMPHKSNPILAENLCGLARLVRASVAPALESISTWNERDITNSSVERVALIDALTLADFMALRAAELLDHLKIFPEVASASMKESIGSLRSEAAVSALIVNGSSRSVAHRQIADAKVDSEESLRRVLDDAGLNPTQIDDVLAVSHIRDAAAALCDKVTLSLEAHMGPAGSARP